MTSAFVKKKDRAMDSFLRITDTTLRDSHQSLWATRMRTDDIMKIIDVIDQVGYYSLEVWGGATFDVCLRFLRENPWERLRLIKSRAKKTPLQMLLRGQNLVGYKNYPDDLVERFIATAVENGIDIFRIFDALNDTRNLEAAIRAVKKYGGHAQGTLSYTISPVHTVKKYVQYASEQVALGIDSLCIKDMAGILSPQAARQLVGALTDEFDMPIQIHSHATSGMAVSTYISGVEAGAGAIDCAIAAMAGFSSQPPVETLYAIFKETDIRIALDIEALRKINKYFTELMPQRMKINEFRPVIDAEILVHQIPGGMISNFRSQLEQQGALDKLPLALDEVTRVRKDLGYPPLVTPTSQIVGTQAVLNVLAGERYKVVPNEVKNYLRGFYGRSPVAVEPEFIKSILGDETPIDHRPADDLAPILPNAPKQVDPALIENEEDILSYCIFPEPALEYFKWRKLPPEKRPATPAELESEKLAGENLPSQSAAVSLNLPNSAEINEPLLNKEDYQGLGKLLEKAALIHLDELEIRKGDFKLKMRAKGGAVADNYDQSEIESNVILPQTKLQPAEPQKAVETKVESYPQTINAVMAGTFYRSAKSGDDPLINEGVIAEAGQPVCIIEAMKLFNEITVAKRCRIIKILCEDGASIAKDQPLMAIEEI